MGVIALIIAVLLVGCSTGSVYNDPNEQCRAEFYLAHTHTDSVKASQVNFGSGYTCATWLGQQLDSARRAHP